MKQSANKQTTWIFLKNKTKQKKTQPQNQKDFIWLNFILW